MSPPAEEFIDPEELAGLIVYILKLQGRLFIKNFIILPPVDV